MARIREYTSAGKSSFFSDRKTQDAVLRNLQTLAESTQHLSSVVKASHPDIPWQDIAGFRNVLVHDYLGVNLERVWEITEHYLPELEQKAKTILQKLGK